MRSLSFPGEVPWPDMLVDTSELGVLDTLVLAIFEASFFLRGDLRTTVEVKAEVQDGLSGLVFALFSLPFLGIGTVLLTFGLILLLLLTGLPERRFWGLFSDTSMLSPL